MTQLPGFVSFVGPANIADRVQSFIMAYHKLPAGSDVEFHEAFHCETGERAIVIDFGGAKHAFTLAEAGILASKLDALDVVNNPDEVDETAALLQMGDKIKAVVADMNASLN